MKINDFFNKNYSEQDFYWWKESNRYSIDENEHTEYNSIILKEAKKYESRGNVLDLGAGEGADSIRLALLGYNVDSIDISDVGVEKIKKNAFENNVKINVTCADIETFELDKNYDIILCNGSLHYIHDKIKVIQKIQEHTNIGGINCISLFSTFSAIPECHKVVSVYPDDENGTVENMYQKWNTLYCKYDRNRKEISHDEMEEHTHSFIKLISRRIL
jgi:tellurite methyltransferase